jgi:hypothetical protein
MIFLTIEIKKLIKKLHLSVKNILSIYFNMKERKFKLCGVLKKSDCIELIRNNLSFEELKSLINPNFNQLIRILNCMNKKELQYIVFNTEKLSIEKITNTIQKTALEEKNTINKNFSNNDNDSEEEDFLSDNVILHEEKLDTGKKPAEIISHENNVMNNIEVKKLDAEIISHENNSINNNEVQKLDTKNQTKIISHENNDEDININNEIINISNEKTEIQFNTEQLDKVYDIKQVKNILLKHNFTAEQIINYLKENANRILTKMKINVNYKKIFTKYSKENYNDIYELMSYISSLTPTTSRAFASRAFASRAFAC